MSLGTLISINCNENKTARLEIENKETRAEIFMQDGNIVHATIDSEIGEQAFYKIIKMRDGIFGIYPDEVTPQVSIEKNWSSLLLEGTRQMDESLIKKSDEIDWANFQLTEPGAKQVEKIIDERMQLMVKALRRVNGVLGVTVVSRDSKVLESDADYDAVEQATRANAILATGQKLGSFVGVNYIRYALISNSQNMIIVNRGQDSIVLLTNKDLTVELLLDEIYNIMKRYR